MDEGLIYRVLARDTGKIHHAVSDGASFWEVLTPLDTMLDRLEEHGALELGAGLGGADRLDTLAPCGPSKIICVGLNYRRHAEEMSKEVPEEPLLFMKPPTALNHHGGVIELPPESWEVHHEGELALVVGRRLRRAGHGEARAALLGYSCANDVTARDIQRRENRYTRAKGFDSFCPVGPAMRLAPGFALEEKRLELRVNGQARQQSVLDDFIFKPAEVLSFVSHIMTLLPGDLVLTGTPHGVGPLVAGDQVEVEIEGIGVLRNDVQPVG